MEAFSLLEDLINLSDEPKKVFFIDKLSWMDTRSPILSQPLKLSGMQE